MLLLAVAYEGWNIDFVPCPVCPFVFHVKVVSEVCAVDVESNVGIQIAIVGGLVDGDRHSGRGNVCCGALWFRFGKSMKFCCEFVNIHVEFRVRRQFVVCEFCILVAFDPLWFDWASQFLV